MSNIRQVQWNEGAPARMETGMILRYREGPPSLIGGIPGGSYGWSLTKEKDEVTGWAWLIQPHELNWLEDMASRKTRTQE